MTGNQWVRRIRVIFGQNCMSQLHGYPDNEHSCKIPSSTVAGPTSTEIKQELTRVNGENEVKPPKKTVLESRQID